MKLLDLFSGAGGCAVGYHRAGYTDILGIDIAPQPRYPFQFVEGDALEFLATVQPGEYDLIHASPPCQRYSACAAMPGRSAGDYPDLLPAARAELQRIGTPWVIENVPRAPLSGVTLCGRQFGLPLYRHRVFEASSLLLQAPHQRHTERLAVGGLNRYFGKPGEITTVAGHQFSRASGSVAMGIDWMTRDELAEAIPPAYTEWIGRQMLGGTP